MIKDDLQAIYDQMCSASAIVFITPVYWHDLSENFKALLDRIKNLIFEGQTLFGNRIAGGYGSGTLEALLHLGQTVGHMGMKAVGRIPVIRFNKDYMIPTLKNAGATFAKHYYDLRFDDFNFWE